ncbi:AAA family ATPase [bacterium]|nr:AAA family ATPase [bacterium]
MIEHSIWNERWRPQSLETYVGNQEIKDRISKCIEDNDIPHLMFHGKAGTGKTTIAKLIVKNIDCDFIYINASDERGIDTVREKITGFASTMSFKPLKVVILDEADYLMNSAQAALRNVIETFSKNTRFIFTCNYIERIIDPLQSRCETYKINPPSKKEVALHLVNILNKEGVSFDKQAIASIVNRYYPDIRKVINTTQGAVKDNALTFKDTSKEDADYLNKMLAILKQPSNKSFNQIRQIVADNGVGEFDNAFRFLFDNLDKYAKSAPTIAIVIAEYQFRSATAPDKEINFFGCIASIINTLNQ